MGFDIKNTTWSRDIWTRSMPSINGWLNHNGDPLDREYPPCVRAVTAVLNIHNFRNGSAAIHPNDVGQALGLLDFPSYKEPTYQCPAIAKLCSSAVTVIKVPCTELTRIEQNFKQYTLYMNSFEFYSETDNGTLYISIAAGAAFVAICVALVMICMSRSRRQESAEPNAQLKEPLNAPPFNGSVVFVN